MIRVALRGLAERRFRSVLTALAIVLGVAMVSGAFVLSDTMKQGADSLSTASYKGTDAVVEARTAFDVDATDGGTAPTIPAGLLDRVRHVPEVGVAVGDVTDLNTRIVGEDGKVVGTGPYFGVGYDSRTPGAQRLSPFRLQSGRFARTADEVVVDAGTAKKQGWEVGDRAEVQAGGPARSFRISGIATFGAVKSIGTATFTVFDLGAAQRLLGRDQAYDGILVAAKPGVSKSQLRTALAGAIPPSARVTSAEKQDRYTLDGLKEFVSVLKTILLAFGGIAIFVGAFTIFNTLSITVAQRSRELALLRTIGSSRRQVLGSVVLEALVIGLLASAVGVFAGYGLGQGLSSVMASLGLDLPQTDPVFGTRTIVVSLLVGVLVTVLAGLGPAMRATRVSPVTVLREGAEIPASRLGRRLPRIAMGMLALAGLLLAVGMFAGGLETGARFAAIVPGCLLLFIGVALVSPRLARPLASLLGRPAARLGGSAGALARGNAMRNPGRTAGTAAALMIGIALVVFVTVLAQGLKTSATDSLGKQIQSDYVVANQDGWSPIEPAAARAVAGAPGVEETSSVTGEQARAFGSTIGLNGIDPATFGRVYRYDWKDGSDATLAGLGANGAIVDKAFAADHRLKVGSPFMVTAAQGTRLRLVVRGIEVPPKLDVLSMGEVTVSSATFARTFPTRQNRVTFVNVDGGTGTSAEQALARRLAAFPDVEVRTAAEYADAQVSWINDMLGILYVMLALAVIVSLFGIVNTLVLSVFERTRELGMLRAIGMTRRQVRRMIRHESVITALIGAALGIAVGLFLAALVTGALSSEGLEFAVPVGSLIAFVVVAIIAGMLAAILPARRAARLDPLAALQYE
jgi:putative ABC transport system permease protein